MYVISGRIFLLSNQLRHTNIFSPALVLFFTEANGILQRHQVVEKTKETHVLPVWGNPGPKSSVSGH